MAAAILGTERDLADDCVNNAFIKVLPRDCGECHKEPYIKTVVKNEALEVLERSARRQNFIEALFKATGILSHRKGVSAQPIQPGRDTSVTAEAILRIEQWDFFLQKFSEHIRPHLKPACWPVADAFILRRRLEDALAADLKMDRRRFVECRKSIRARVRSLWDEYAR